MCAFEEIRQRYKPIKVRRLFVGESRPINGTFFYFENSNLYKYTKQAFEEIYSNFFDLKSFMNDGYWLYDVCEIPVNGMSDASRRQCINDGIPQLMYAIREMEPEIVIVVKKGELRTATRELITNLGYIDGHNLFYLSFPACGRQQEYKSGLVNILRDIG